MGIFRIRWTMDRSFTRKSLSHTTYFRVEALFSLILSLTVLVLLMASSMVSAADVINTEAVTIDENETTAASNVSGTEYTNKLNTLKTKNETAVSNVSATEHMNKAEILNIDEKETATSNASATLVEKTETLKMNNETTAHKTHIDDIPVPLPIPLTHHAVPLIARHNSHHVNVYIGTPPQRRLVIVDTGSRTLVVPCKPCTHCGHQHFSREFFDPKKSLTDIANHCNEDECKFVTESIDSDCPKSNECNFMLSYSEGSSIRGFELEDIVWLGTDNYEQSVKVHMQKAVPLSFGCESHETGIVADQYADGIMGLISESHKQDNIVDVMYRTGVIPNYAFSMCLTKTAGVLSLGGTALFEHHLEPMRMIPLTSSQYYTVSVKALYVGNVKIESKLVPDLVEMSFNEGRGAVVDSGTTDTFLPKAISRDFQRAWKNFTLTKHTNHIHSYTFEEFQLLPDVTIELTSGYKWVIRSHAYMDEITPGENDQNYANTYAGWQGSRTFVNRIYLDEFGGAVLGSNAMVNHDIVFDIEHKMVGFAQANCHQE